MAGGLNELDQVFQDNLFPLIRAEGYNIENTVADIKTRFSTNEQGALVYEADFGGGFIPWGSTSYLTYQRSLSGVSDGAFFITGTDDTIETGETGDFNTTESIGNNHVGIVINSLTGTGTATITGTSVSEETNVPIADTEVLTIDEVASYQSSKKWLQITSIVIAGPSAINYDISRLGYLDLSNNDFRLMGYRADLRSQSNTADVKLEITRVKDLGAGKFELITLENIGVDSTNGNGNQVDSLRTGGSDRSFTYGSTAFPNNTDYVFKQGDFFQFFQDDAFVLGKNNNGGIQIRLSGEGDADISGVDSIGLGLAIIKTT